MVTAEGNELFADGAAPVGLPLALLRVRHHPLHLVAAWQATVGVPALAGVDEALDASLDAQLPRLLGVAGRHSLTPTPVKVKAKLLHLVEVAIVSTLSSSTNNQVIINGSVCLNHCDHQPSDVGTKGESDGVAEGCATAGCPLTMSLRSGADGDFYDNFFWPSEKAKRNITTDGSH